MVYPKICRECLVKKNSRRTPAVTSVLKKLKEVAGDSITEALVAVLIAALGATLLATMVTSSMNVTVNSEAKLKSLYAAEKAIAEKESGVESSVSIKGKEISGVEDMDIKVDLYSSDDYASYVTR